MRLPQSRPPRTTARLTERRCPTAARDAARELREGPRVFAAGGRAGGALRSRKAGRNGPVMRGLSRARGRQLSSGGGLQSSSRRCIACSRRGKVLNLLGSRWRVQRPVNERPTDGRRFFRENMRG